MRESEATTEHPVHLGGHAAVLEELKVNPEVKKPPGRQAGGRWLHYQGGQSCGEEDREQ